MTIAGWQVTKGMPLKPHRCVGCGQTGQQTEDGPPDAYFASGVDINWGDSVYLCGTCVRILGELRGMIDVDEAEKLREAVRQYKDKYETAKRGLELSENRIARMLDGVAAKKEATKARTPTKKKEPANA